VALILLVEDEVAVAEVIAEALTQSNYDVRVAPTANDGLAMAEMDRPDAIILDINLPGSSGTATLDRLHRIRPDVPIIMLTANVDEQLARETLRRGAFDYVTKPVNLDHLIRIVEFALPSQ
jgi:two-component system, NtrC family, response regulator AtoC